MTKHNKSKKDGRALTSALLAALMLLTALPAPVFAEVVGPESELDVPAVEEDISETGLDTTAVEEESFETELDTTAVEEESSETKLDMTAGEGFASDTGLDVSAGEPLASESGPDLASDDALASEAALNSAPHPTGTITGFAPFDITANYLAVDRASRAPLDVLTSAMPSTLTVYLDNSEEPADLPVTWTCIEADYETTEAGYVQFSPVFPETCPVSGDIDIYTEAPYIGVFLIDRSLYTQEAVMTVAEDGLTEYTAADPLNGAPAVAKYTYTSSPYEAKIFDYLTFNLGHSTAAAVGIMTNIYCESSFFPNNLQNTGNNALGMTDSQYTAAVDNGSYGNFVNDKYGYGLIQWTYYTRKQNLLNFARSRKVSIANYEMQLDFMTQELSAAHYATLRSTLKGAAASAKGAYDAAYAWCYYFEQPANYPAVSVTRGNLAKNSFWPIYGAKYTTTYERVAGSNRYKTAIAAADKLLSLRGKKKFDAVVLANADNYPDALSGAALAGKYDAPILLLKAMGDNSGSKLTMTYIKDHLTAGGKVYILGSESAIGTASEEALIEAGYDVTRLGGANRYETNLTVVGEIAPETGADIYIATGKNYADALSVSGISARTGNPVILVKDKLSDAALAQIEALAPAHIYILGGGAAVPASVEEQLKAYKSVKRLEGSNRYATAVKIAETLSASKPKAAVVATGTDFPDGLVAGLLASEINAPVLLAKDTHYKEAAKYAAAKNIPKYYIMGGEPAVPSRVVRGLMR